MRTTLSLDDDVFREVKAYAERRDVAIGKAVSELVRRGLHAPLQTRVVNGFHVVDLPPGRYRIDIGAFGSMHERFHYAPDCASVEVALGSETPLHLQGAYGDYRPASRWELSPG